MHLAEKLSLSIRHNRILQRAPWLWDGVRPFYDRIVSLMARNGLLRVMNGTDPILLLPQYRHVTEIYEPGVWRSLMNEIKPGDSFADVGVFIGLYTIAAAKRVGPAGHVMGFEPDNSCYRVASRHVQINGVQSTVDLIRAAVGDRNGVVSFENNNESGHITSKPGEATAEVECVTLDRVLPDRHLDVLKIDVEGYEEKVLRGAKDLLRDAARKPRVIYIEVHPYAWRDVGTTSDSLLNFLGEYGYEAFTIAGERVGTIETYGEIIARKRIS